MFNPISTYRVQFNKDFTFQEFSAVIPYLHRLGIKTIYASPIFEAVPGSMHGYDLTDPNRINPEIGSLEELKGLSARLRSYDMYWIQDIVPNHMGFHMQNRWLMDVLEKGEASSYRKYFDIVSRDLENNPLMVPFLGDDLEQVIARGELELKSWEGKSWLKYFDACWPLRRDIDLGAMSVSEIAASQYYRLCSHTESNSRINYRRFFTVNSLICLNVQLPEVFDAYHQLIGNLVKEGIFHGLRIDHIDGLANPEAYLKQLRTLCGEQTYIIVEKILEPGEQLPSCWPVQGTTGYDYLGLANQLYTNGKAERKFDTFYNSLSSLRKPLPELILNKKRSFLQQHMQGELHNLYQLMQELQLLPVPQSSEPRADAVVNEVAFKKLITELLVRLPVYRLYSDSYPLDADEAAVLEAIFEDLAEEAVFGEQLGQFRSLVMGQFLNEAKSTSGAVFFRRLMQFSGPLMAKGVEDTLMYTYNRFIGNNEVGDSPELFGITAEDFQSQIQSRSSRWPLTMNASATHDTKRGEDARARLAVLTDLRNEWLAVVEKWRELNHGLKVEAAPDANDEYFIYQTLVATCPDGSLSSENYQERLLDYMEKALRESKRNSDWDEPNAGYESGTKEFICALLKPGTEFWQSFQEFLNKVSYYGKLVTLSSLVLKHTLPGIPDTYQGTELWDLSMVDPDNRRLVDYSRREKMLQEVSTKPETVKGAVVPRYKERSDGVEKLALLQRLFEIRQQCPELIAKGAYLPLQVEGAHAKHVVAFVRQHQDELLLVATAINFAGLVSSPEQFPDLDWSGTRLLLPAVFSGVNFSLSDQLGSGSIQMIELGADGVAWLSLDRVFTEIPAAVFRVNLA